MNFAIVTWDQVSTPWHDGWIGAWHLTMIPTALAHQIKGIRIFDENYRHSKLLVVR